MLLPRSAGDHAKIPLSISLNLTYATRYLRLAGRRRAIIPSQAKGE